MMYVTRVGFVRPNDGTEALSIESMLQRVLRGIEGRGSLVISASVIIPSHVEGEVAESFIVHASMDVPQETQGAPPGSKLVISGN